MSPRIKWGLLAGGAVALLNLCGGVLIGAVNNCITIITVSIAAAAAGYFCARQEPAAEAIKAGATAGAIIGVISLVSQLIGGVIGGLVGASILASVSPIAQQDPSVYTQGAGLGIGIIVASAIGVGIILIFAGAGIGALAAKLSVQQAPAAGNMPGGPS